MYNYGWVYSIACSYWKMKGNLLDTPPHIESTFIILDKEEVILFKILLASAPSTKCDGKGFVYDNLIYFLVVILKINDRKVSMQTEEKISLS